MTTKPPSSPPSRAKRPRHAPEGRHEPIRLLVSRRHRPICRRRYESGRNIPRRCRCCCASPTALRRRGAKQVEALRPGTGEAASERPRQPPLAYTGLPIASQPAKTRPQASPRPSARATPLPWSSVSSTPCAPTARSNASSAARRRSSCTGLPSRFDVAAASVEPAPSLPPATISEVMLPKGVRHGTRAAQIFRVLPLYGAANDRAPDRHGHGRRARPDLPTLSGMVKAGQISRVSAGHATPTDTPPAARRKRQRRGETDVKAQSAEIPPQITPAIPPAEDGDDTMPPADASLLALANRELADRLARVAHVLRGSGLEGLRIWMTVQTCSPRLRGALTGAYQMALADLDSLRRARQLSASKAPVDDWAWAEAFLQAGVVVDLRAQLRDPATRSDARRTCLSGQDRYTADGYLVRASKRKPRTLLDKDKARDAALSSIRAGAKRAEVFALVPIGHARRGAAWWPA